ncbi:LADA_0D06370g1_1 [Lachancea dasiensis]|uniref:LADA_0D06370g1_1 n=1 Tax=Lachancea dasiensis TaxID=1072105 RepID=A0A1G4J6G5_9SACH|nr:LADA_0D06370g1_1 [Lachancea dasiensis]
MSLEARYKRFLSYRADARKFTPFWHVTVPDFVKPHPKPIDLGAGMPNEGLFPVESVHLNVLDHPFEHQDYGFRSPRLHRDHDSRPPKETSDAGKPAPHNERDLVSQKFSDGSMVDIWRYEPAGSSSIPIQSGFQYNQTRGLTPLVDFCRDFISSVHPPAYDEWDLTFANGSSDSLFKVFETLSDHSTTVLVEEFTFPPTLSNISSTGATAIPIKGNSSSDPEVQGIDTEYLANLLDNWSESEHAHLPKPRLLYTIPTGQNPTGMTLSLAKRKEIYALAEKHDFLIVEDDPYGYLRFPFYDSQNPRFNPYEHGGYTIEQYRSEVLAKSFITLDTSGRVIRCETFSKVFFPGLRLSFIVANKYFISKLVEFEEVSTRAPSGVSQAVVHNVIQKWAHSFDSAVEAWLSWVMKVAGQYTHRRNVLFEALQATPAFQKGLFTLVPVSAGMFAFLQLNLDKIPNLDKPEEAMRVLGYKFMEEGVQAVQGVNMAVCKKFSFHRSQFLRVTYAYAANDEELQEASKRLSSGLERLVEAYAK